MKLSIIVPVHNGGEHLAHCLEALLACKEAEDQLIVVDDGSTDGSEAVARPHATGGPRSLTETSWFSSTRTSSCTRTRWVGSGAVSQTTRR